MPRAAPPTTIDSPYILSGAGVLSTVSPAPHRRTLGWVGAAALAMGGSNQSLFLIAALFAGQGAIAGQGSAAVPLLAAGLLLSWAAAPGWTELVLMSPGRVGGIAAACSDAFRPYSLVLSALTGSCYWWGWVPTCGLTALLAASAIRQWFLPALSVEALAIVIVCAFAAINLCGLRLAARVAIPLAALSGALAFLAAFVPVALGRVDWHEAASFHLITPFRGWFGTATSLMAGLYLIGFAAPAFEAAACYVGEMKDPARNLPRAMLASAATAGLYFIALPVIWLGVLGPQALGRDLATELGPTYAPLFGSLAKAMAAAFIVFNMLHGTLQPLGGASRTLSQLSDDGIFPRFLGRRRNGAPWAAILVTAGAAIAFLIAGDPLWLVAAANFTYLLSICLPSIAVWLLRRNAPEADRPYRAPRGAIGLGVVAALVWGISTVLGFEQFGLPTVLLGLGFAYAGAGLYAWRALEDRALQGLHGIMSSLHLRLTAAMLAGLLVDGAGYIVAIFNMPRTHPATVAALQDIFVAVAILTIGVGLVMPAMIAHAATRDLAETNATLHEGTEALLLEIRERELAEQRLLHVASHDALTGLANRAQFMQRFRHLVSRLQRRTDGMSAVLFIDLDRFKMVNDSLGHLTGDLLLVAVARRFERCLRPGDTLARFGGDEFTILLEDIAAEADATAFAERLLRELDAPIAYHGGEMFATASIGIAVTRIGFDLPEDVLRNADIAMYRAKERGKKRYEVFRPELFTQAVALLQLENDLKLALERREFLLFYQPIVSLQTGELRGFEALVRWQHPIRGLLTPDAFIPAAEESGAILSIGQLVLEKACAQARTWQDMFARDPPLSVSVNISAKQFSEPHLLREIDAAFARNMLDGRHIAIEITESAIMRDPEVATASLVALHEQGIAVHLDDFGTGYSSLGYLHRFPVDNLKIDRSFVSMSGAALGNPDIIRTITSLAQSLSISTTAEGVETEQQFEHLRELGCTYAQGYLISRPLNFAAAGALIARWPQAAPPLATDEL